ncbi:hypothetical protein MKW92_025965 [Papaver armeniacum]|nr:hypothetical protein MKW92_025965 [Papaver armeniacum]
MAKDEGDIGRVIADIAPVIRATRPDFRNEERIIDDRAGNVVLPVSAGIFDDRLPDLDFGGGSMLVGPRWFCRAGGHPGRPNLLGPLGIPAGARFDPYGPPEVPGFEPTCFGGNPRKPYITHPDLEPLGDPDYE